MKKAIAYKIAITICLMALITISLTACNGVMTFDLKNITEVDLTSGSDGTIIYITDTDQLEKLVQSFNDSEFLKGESANNSTGWSYRLRFWQDDKMQAEIVVTDDKTIKYNDYFYQNGNGVIDLKYYEELLDYDTNSRVAVETDLGVEMIIESVTPKGLSFSFENTTESEYTYGGDYVLYVNNNNSWEPVQPIIENWAFTSEGYTILPNSKTDVTSIDWTWMYGELLSGEYRFQKTILYVRSPGDFDKYVFEQDFSLQSLPVKAPLLYVSLIADNSPIQRVQAIQLTTSWMFIDENGNGSGYEADSPHPLQLQPDDFNDVTLYLDNASTEIEMQFSDNYLPQSVSVQRWKAEYATGSQDINNVLDKSETVEVINGNIIGIDNDGNDYIYEVYAKWEQGSSYYTFRVNGR